MVVQSLGYRQLLLWPVTVDNVEEVHAEWLEHLWLQKLGITEAINHLVHLYAHLYGVSAHRINCGMCDQFAADIAYLIEGAVDIWGNELCPEDMDESEVDDYAYHCIVVYQGRYYDSQHPRGVDCFTEITAFHASR